MEKQNFAQKTFSFLDRLSGNKKFWKGLNDFKKLSISDSVKEDFSGISNKDFLKLMTYLRTANYSRLSEPFTTPGGCNAASFSYKSCLSQYKEKKITFWNYKCSGENCIS